MIVNHDHIPRSQIPRRVVGINSRVLYERGEQRVLADVQVPRPIRRSASGAAVAVTASVPGTVVDPVRVHPSPAQPAQDQSGEHIPANLTLVVLRSVRIFWAATKSASLTNAGCASDREMAHSAGFIRRCPSEPADWWRLHTSRPV